MSHCSNCGAAINAHAKYCFSCGKPVLNAFDFEDESKSNPFLTLIGNIVGGGLGIIMGLIGLVLSFALPIIVVMALISGPSETWDRISAWIPGDDEESEVCRGFDDWANETEDKFTEWQAGVEKFGAIIQWSDQEAQIIIDDTNDLINYLRNSEPPQEAATLNSMYIDLLDLTLDLAEAQQQGDNGTLLFRRGEMQPKLEQLMLEHDRVVERCD